MAIINFPPTAGEPTDGSFTYTFDGVLYSWTGSYWTANTQSGFDNRYVEVAGDTMTGDLTLGTDPSAPNITLQSGGLGEFSGGVKVTGGTEASVENGIAFTDGRQVDLVADSDPIIQLNADDTYKLGFSPKIDNATGNHGYGSVFSPSITNSNFTLSTNVLRNQPNLEGLTTPKLNFFSTVYLNLNAPPTAVQNCYGFNVEGNIAFGTVLNVGYYSSLATNGTKNYNFYAAGTAPNYFQGTITTPGTYNNTNTNTSNYLRITTTGLIQRSTSSRRYKDNIRDCSGFGSGSALDFISQVQPRMWEDYSTGETVCGFIAEELFELGGEHLVSFAPWSREVTTDETNDEGEVIGTRTTKQYPFVGNGSTPTTKDGGALTDDSEVVDGLNEKGLVITLVKALQEAATKIEALEAEVQSLKGGSN